MDLSIYCIDLSKYPIKSINDIADFNSLYSGDDSEDAIDLYSLKKKGYNKIWIDVKESMVLAFSKKRKNKLDAISLTREFHDKLKYMDFAKMDDSYYEKSDNIIKVFKFDITKNLEEVREICDKYRLDYDIIAYNIEMDKRIRKIWLCDNDNGLIYYESKGWETLVSKYFIEDIRNAKEWELRIPKDIEAVVNRNKIILDVDIILDKISAYGIEALTKEELDFLNNQ